MVNCEDMAKARTAPPTKAPKRPTPADRIPRRVMQPTLDDHLEILTRAIFQAGLSWALIDARWDAFRLGYDHFDIVRVSQYGDWDVDRLMATDRLIQSAKKIAGTIENARTLIATEREFGSIAAYVAGFAAYADLYADARKRFALLGDLSCYYWLFRTGNSVPVFETWLAGQPKDHPRMREMVLTGRAAAESSERPDF
jgi:3-methyladenine DNA glycosylase Tag